MSNFFKHNWLLIILVSVTLIFWAAAYQPVMFNFFTSDDFYFISQLSIAKHHPSFLFHGVDAGTPYYRPLLYILLFCEYLLFGANGQVLRIVSLSYELFSVFVFALLLREFVPAKESNNHGNSSANWCLFSAGLFLLYPIHTEPVNWFICTNDLLANLFILLSLLFYIWWQRRKKIIFELISCFFALCAFFTKESTVILPGILLLYELLLNNSYQNNHDSLSNKKSFKDRIINGLRLISAHLILLAGYFVIRKINIGYFFSNERDITFDFPQKNIMLFSWIKSLQMIFVPLSSEAFYRNYAVYLVWLVVVASLVILTLKVLTAQKYGFRLAAFLICWFILCLLPMLRFFLITPELLNARYGYLASVPLCAFLMYGLAFVSIPKGLTHVRYSIVFLTLSLSCFILHTNNVAWAETGTLTNNLLSGFREVHKELANQDQRIYFLNIPISYKGVAVDGLQNMESMNHIPFSDMNFSNGVRLPKKDQALPIEIMHYDLEWKNIFAHFYYWNMEDEQFHSINFPKEIEQTADNRASYTIALHKNGFNQPWRIIGSLEKANITSSKKLTFFFQPKNLCCWTTDLIILKIHAANSNKEKRNSITAELNYTNDIQQTIDYANQLSVTLKPNQKDQFVTFVVRGIPVWSLGGRCKTVQISFPKDCSISIDQAVAASLDNLMPKMRALYPGYHKDNGTFDLCDKYPKSLIKYDASSIKDCAGVFVEVIGPNQNFKQLNSPDSDENSLIQVTSMNPTGCVKIDNSMFAFGGLFKVRLRPINTQAKQVGYCSDHFILHVIK